MIKFNFPHKTYDIKSSPTELTLDEYETIVGILSDENEVNYSKFINILVALGMDIDDVEDMNEKHIVEFVKHFYNEDIKTELKPSFEIEGYKYIGIEDGEKEPVITPFINKKIEELFTNKHKGYLGEVLAVMLKREGLTSKEHKQQSHIKHKAKLFRDNISAKDAIPYIVYASDGLFKSINEIVNGVSK